MKSTKNFKDQAIKELDKVKGGKEVKGTTSRSDANLLDWWKKF